MVRAPLSLYIHIPFCVSKCAYCDFFSTPNFNQSLLDEYTRALANEISFRLKASRVEKLNTVYIGGGTPSVLSPVFIGRIAAALSSYIDENTETTMELNSADVTEELLFSLEKLGVNRISVGLQAFSDKVLKAVCRRGGRKENLFALETIKKFWKGRSSFDLISALPGQTEQELLEGLSILVCSGAEHISLYSLTIEEETPLFSSLEKGDFSYDFDFADKLWISGRDFLLKNGYVQYEVSNFYKEDGAKARDATVARVSNCMAGPCRHNLCYWNLESYLGCGSGATGTLYDFSSASGERFTNTKNISKYIEYWSRVDSDSSSVLAFAPGEKEELSYDTLVFEFFMMGLRKAEGISLSDFEGRFGCPVPDETFKIMNKWEKDGLSVFYDCDGDKRFSMTKEGLLFLNRFLEELI